MTTRVAGKRGRLPQRQGADRFRLRYIHEYATDPVLTRPTYPVDVSGGITDWGMLGNDELGDCGEAGIRHVEMSTAVAIVKAACPTFTDEDARSEYFAYTGGKDTGVVLADFLLWLYRRGRIKAFAPVDHTRREYVDGAMQRFGAVYCGVQLTDADMQRFNESKKWIGGTPNPREGHCIVKVRATPHEDVWVTWGKPQPSTLAWTEHCLVEAWAVVTHEEEHFEGLAELLADIDALGGTGATAKATDPVAKPSLLAKLRANLPLIGAVIATLAGIAGTVLTPLYGEGLANGVQTVLQAISGFLLTLPTYHVVRIAAVRARARAMARASLVAKTDDR
ncbi:MAG TPA: hypothetical protein VHB02_05975 [Acidimicrobiales bacterium]|nr:hypothetical protein [Acidimicrobiales bacterium]